MGELAHQGEIVGDENVSQAQIGLQREQHLDDVGLDGDVERWRSTAEVVISRRRRERRAEEEFEA